MTVMASLRFADAGASDITDVSPLTDRIILVKFDDGSVNYPNGLQVNRLDLTLASNAASYSISSTDDVDYTTAVNPIQIGRKSKGTEFIKDPPWAGSSFDPRGKPWASEHYIYLFLGKALQPGKRYTLNTGPLGENGSQWNFVFEEKAFRSEAVHVNTIGYETNAPKYGYVYQWMGDRGGLDLSGYSGNLFHIYREGEEVPVCSGTLVRRKSATNPETGQSNDTPNQNFLGAEVYECDFSEVTADGTYSLVVEGIGGSYPFRIGKDALWEAYTTCARSLYYQRSGIRLAPPYTDNGYVRPVNQNTRVTSDDGTSFEGKLLYSNYSFTDWEDGNSGGNSQAIIRDSAIGHPLDVAGWYHDAGDWDGYHTHQRIPILLMTTFEYAPERFADGDLNIPESGNGIPDLLDEASWLIKFNYRLRRELVAKGYSDGGVGGARVCADVFTGVDGNAETNSPSWKEYRRTVVTKADAFMTYLYAGQAAQFAVLLKQLGKDPSNFPVEMLDQVDFGSMTREAVDWEKEAREAYAWASAPANQPSGSNNYGSNALDDYRMYAAANLYRLTNEEAFNADARTILEGFKNRSELGEDERWGVYSYLLADNYGADRSLQSALKNVAISTARLNNTNSIRDRACRWGGNFSMPMLVGQGTTPWMFESIVAYGLTGDKAWSDAVHTTADYFLGSNPLHTTWATHLGPRPPTVGFHLDSRYNNGWDLYPGFVPYGPWSMAYDYVPYTFTIDGVVMEGGHGPWNKDWANFSQYPLMEEWPGHERWNSNIHAPLSSENTVHQNAVYAALTYGFVNARMNTNATASESIGSIGLDRSSLILTRQGAVDTLSATIDIANAGFGLLRWESDDSRIAHVDGMGRVTGVTSGSCNVRCSTLDGSVSASCVVTCDWDETNVDSIWIEPDSLRLVEGQTAPLTVFFSPEEATNKFVDWSYSQEGIAGVDELGILTALSPGVVEVVATSLNGKKTDTCFVEVREAVDYVIADFDKVIPVTTYPQPGYPQIYTPNGGTCDTAAANPMACLSNESEKVVEYGKPEGDWTLLGMVLPTDEFQDLALYSQFQFKYLGSGIRNFYIQLIPEEGDQLDITSAVEGEEVWKLFVLDLDVSFTIKQFNVFVNPQGNPASLTCYFDDFILAGRAANWYSGLTLSDQKLEMASGSENLLTASSEGNPFSWISTNPGVVTVDQEGRVFAVSKGTATIRAVPLYGEARECLVKVDGGGEPEPGGYERKMILDFEAYELDWSAGYGGYAWGSATFEKVSNPDKDADNDSDYVVSWERDGTNYGGGLGIIFPAVSTRGWERISLQAYSDSPFTSVRIEFYSGEELLAEAASSAGVHSGVWTQVMFDLVDMGASDVGIDKIHFIYALGTLDVMTVYTDNVWLERGIREDTTVAVTGIAIEGPPSLQLMLGETFQLRAVILPDSATNQGVIWSSDQPQVVSVSESGLLAAAGLGTAVITAAAEAEPGLKATVTVTTAMASGIEPAGAGTIQVFPNPAESQLTVVSPSGMAEIRIFTIAGEAARRVETNGKTGCSIEPLNLGKGLYLIKIIFSDGNVAYRKLLIQ
jgi:endoglucanase